MNYKDKSGKIITKKYKENDIVVITNNIINKNHLFSSKDILEMSNNNLLKIIKNQKYIGYRLGDIVLNYPCSRVFHNKTCYLPHKEKYPDSIAIKYTNIYKGDQSLGFKIGNNIKLDDNLLILKTLCDELKDAPKPNDDSLVAAIRLGDMIDHNKQRLNGNELARLGGTFETKNGGIRRILSAMDIVNEAKKKNINKIILIGKCYNSKMKSVEYLKNMCLIITKNNCKCYWMYNFSPDDDLAFISNAKHLISGPGGFCLTAEAISNFRFNKNK